MTQDITRFVKIAATNKFLPRAAAAITLGIGAVLLDGEINTWDLVALPALGTAMLGVGAVAFSEQRTYRAIEYICKTNGFTESIFTRPEWYSKARLYARETGQEDEFDRTQRYWDSHPCNI